MGGHINATSLGVVAAGDIGPGDAATIAFLAAGDVAEEHTIAYLTKSPMVL